MPEKPVFNPNSSFDLPKEQNKPKFNPKGEVKVIESVKSEFDVFAKPEDTTSFDEGVNKAIDLIKTKGGRNGSIILDSELDVLKDVLKNPSATQEQRKNAILTIQGYDAKHDDKNTMYYNKLEDNGVYVPTALAYGEKPPVGYKVASVWGNQKEAGDDTWYQDLSKSVTNGVLGAAQGAIDLTQVGTVAVTGEESKYLNKLSNTAEALKFKKDEDLSQSIYNSEDIQKWSDLLDKDRFNFSPQNLWGTINNATESLVEFYGGAKGASKIIPNKKAAIFTGSLAAQIGDIYDSAKEAGLEGRDAAAYSMAVGTPVAALDAFFGLDGKIMSNSFNSAKKELIKNAVKAVEKDAAGNITEQGFKELAKITTAEYGKLAKNGVKEIVKDVVSEGTQEAAQDFVQKAGEQLWDKFSDEDKAKFGTDAFDAKSFGSYMNSFATGLVSGAPMSLANTTLKNRNEEQSNNVYARVKAGEESVKALRADLDNAVKSGEISQADADIANHKINSYQQYHELTKKYDFKPEDEKKAFELSFQIQGLNTEIPTDTKEIHNLDPISKAEVKSKETMRNELQKELDEIILKGQAKKEPVVAKKTTEKLTKETKEGIAKEKKGEVSDLDELMGRFSNLKVESVGEEGVTELDELTAEKKPARLKLDETPSEVFNVLNDLQKKQVVQEHLKTTPNKSMEGFIEEGQNKKLHVNLGGGKYIVLAQSVESTEGKKDNIMRENLPKTKEVGVIKDSEGQPLISFKEPVVVKREEILQFDEKGEPVMDNGKQKKKAVINVYNGENGKYIVSVREHKYGKSKYTPKEVEQLQGIIAKANGTKVEEVAPLIDKVSKTETSIVTEKKPTEKVSKLNPKEEVKVEESKKETKLSTNKTRNQRKVKDKNRIAAGKLEVFTPQEIAMQYFINNGFVSRKALSKFFKGDKTELFKRQNLNLENAPSLDEIAHDLWEESDKRHTTEDFKNALEQVLLSYTSPIKMAQDLLKNHGQSELELNKLEERTLGSSEEPLSERIKKVKEGAMSSQEIEDFLAKESYQKEAEKQLGEDVFKSSAEKLNDDTKDLFQKIANRKGDIKKTVDVIKKALPKIKIEYTTEGDYAGKLSADGKTITINVNYAGLDTPIHEAGHILIDALGYDNKIVQKAFEQLYDTDLYKEVEKAYPELSTEELNKEVLAEAIGQEGAGIFDNEADKSKFRQYLDYIFDWFKRKLGLDKNIAKSLAKQIIAGIGTKNLEGTETGKEQLQKESEGKKKKVRNWIPETKYRQDFKFRDLKQEENDLATIEKALGNKELPDAVKTKLEAIKNRIEGIREKDNRAYRSYIKDIKKIEEIRESEDLSEYSFEELIELYNKIKSYDPDAKDALMNNVKKRIAYSLWKQGTERLSENESFIEDVAKRKDISGGIMGKMKGLLHFTENQPEMQEFSKIFDEVYTDMISETNDEQMENEKLAREVVKDKNKSLVGKATDFFVSDNSKYFEYMVKPNAIEVTDKEGEVVGYKDGFWTIEEAKEKGFSKAQIEYLKFVRETIAKRKKVDAEQENDPYNDEVEAVRLDKGFQEAYKTSGLVEAMSYYLGGGRTNLHNVRIDYKGKPTSFGDIESDIISKSQKGIVGKAKAIGEILFYNYHARKQLKKGFNVDEKTNPMDVKGDSQYSINPDGNLTSKFDRARSLDRGYSKDFFKAMNEYIHETNHVKHMNKIVPLANSLELMAKEGYESEGVQAKKNLAEWISDWRKLHVFKESDANAPELDVMLKFLRKLTSMTTMMFSYPAQLVNAGMGIYNNFKSENAATLKTGYSRLFSKKGIDPYARALIKKYNIVSLDLDSNPRPFIGNVFDKYGMLLTKWGEYQTQASLALGLLDENIYNSFEFKTDEHGVEKLVIKEGVDEKKVKNAINEAKNRVSSIQGLYSDKDKRNIMNNELGKAVFQFKVWMPDWWKERFGAEYIDRNNIIRKGSWNMVTRKGIKDLKRVVNEKGWRQGLFDGKTPESKAFLSNLKGLMAVTAMAAFKYQDDDDDKKRRSALSADNALGQLLFVFDPNQLKYTIKSPAAIIGTTVKFIETAEHLIKMEEDKKGNKKIVNDIVDFTPGFKGVKKTYKEIEELTSEE
jgi:hypothetical protein